MFFCLVVGGRGTPPYTLSGPTTKNISDPLPSPHLIYLKSLSFWEGMKIKGINTYALDANNSLGGALGTTM